jgi:hypothetical protein
MFIESLRHHAALAAFALAAALTTAATLHAQSPTVSVTWDFLRFRGPFDRVFSPSCTIPSTDPLCQTSEARVNGRTVDPTGFQAEQPSSSPSQNFSVLGLVNGLTGRTVTFGTTRFGTSANNILEFTPAQDLVGLVGEPVRLGTLSFTNGNWWGSSSEGPSFNVPSFFDFRLTTTSTDQRFNQTFEGHIRLIVTFNNAPNPATLAGQEAQADYVYIEGSNTAGTGATGQLQTTNAFRVFDSNAFGYSNIGSAELWAEFNSLDLLGFRNPTGGGFVTQSIDVLGPDGANPTPVPEPNTALLVATAATLGALWGRVRRRSS